MLAAASGGGGEDEAPFFTAAAERHVGDQEVAQALFDLLAADRHRPFEGLDLHADRAAAEEEIEILVALANQGLVLHEFEPAERPETALVEVTPDRGVSGALGVNEFGFQCARSPMAGPPR